MRLNRLLLTAALGTTGCAHAIDVFVPPSDVPPKTEVVAAVRTGEVRTFGPDARMETHGIVRENGRPFATAPTDVLVVRASAGDQFGHLHVARAATGELLTLGGVLVAIAGTIASLAAAGVCNASVAGPGALDAGCFGGGAAGTGASIALGVTMIALGIGGPLRIVDDRRVQLGASGFRIWF